MIHDIFPTALGIYYLDVDLDFLKAELDKIQVCEHSLVQSGSSSWSKNNLLDNKQFANLKNNIDRCLDEYCSETGLPKLGITISWHNYMQPGGKTIRHRHEFSSVSGAFYIKAVSKTCSLTLHNPLQPYMMMHPKEQQGKYNSTTLSIDAVPGKLIIFPSWLEHETEINTSDQTRLVISFNASVKNTLT